MRVDDRAVLDRARDIIRDRHLDTIAERRRPGHLARLSPVERAEAGYRCFAERLAVDQLEVELTIADALASSDALVRETVLLALGDLS